MIRDLVDKQEVIDTVYKSVIGKPILTGYRDLIIALKSLPSAQPELIRCKDCYHYPGEYTDCPMIGWARNGEDFCSKAERRSDG